MYQQVSKFKEQDLVKSNELGWKCIDFDLNKKEPKQIQSNH